MRTTVNIDDDLLQAVKQHAKNEDISLGEAMSYFIREGMMPRERLNYSVSESGLPVIHVAEGTPPITMEDVKRALEDED